MPLKVNQEQLPEMNLTSMIDVLFLLVIFFMAGTQFTEMERKIKLEVPRVNGGQALGTAAARRVINVYADGTIMMDHAEWRLDDLRKFLQQEIVRVPDMSIVVRGDGAATLQDAANVLAVCADAGVREMGMSAKPNLRR